MFISVWAHQNPARVDNVVSRLHGCLHVAFYLVVPPILMTIFILAIILLFFMVRIFIIGVVLREMNMTLWAVANLWCALTVDPVIPGLVEHIMKDLFFSKYSAFNEWGEHLKKGIEQINGE
jgi:hypothetical protein